MTLLSVLLDKFHYFDQRRVKKSLAKLNYYFFGSRNLTSFRSGPQGGDNMLRKNVGPLSFKSSLIFTAASVTWTVTSPLIRATGREQKKIEKQSSQPEGRRLAGEKKIQEEVFSIFNKRGKQKVMCIDECSGYHRGITHINEEIDNCWWDLHCWKLGMGIIKNWMALILIPLNDSSSMDFQVDVRYMCLILDTTNGCILK